MSSVAEMFTNWVLVIAYKSYSAKESLLFMLAQEFHKKAQVK